jgi:hypothetical protein
LPITLIAAALAILGSVRPAAPATITLVDGTLDASLVARISTVTPLFLDVRGDVVFTVGGVGPAGPVFATDKLDLVTPTPFPASVVALLARNATLDQSAIVTFDPGSFRIDGELVTVPSDFELDGSTLTVQALGVPQGPVSDPALLAFLGPLLFSFAFDFLIIDPAGAFPDLALLNFDLVGVTQIPALDSPRPSTPVAAPGPLALAALGGLALSLAHSRRRRRQ